MKNAIVIKIREDVSLTERTKYVILLKLMKALKMSVDWTDKGQIYAFSLRMLVASLGDDAEEVNED